MKVLHISSEKSWRGGEQQIAYLIAELARFGVKSSVLSRENSDFHKYCDRNSIDNYSKSFSGLGIITTALYLVKISKGFDLIHAHTARAHFVAVLATIFGLKRPIVAARRVDFVPSKSWLTKWRYKHAQVVRVLCVSRKIKCIMDEYLSQIKDKTVVVYSGIDLNKFKDTSTQLPVRKVYGIPDGHIIVGNTSALAEHKDYFTFLDAALKLVNSKSQVNFSFIIFGDGPLKSEIVEYVKKLGLTKHVLMTGFVNNLNQLLPQIDVFMITSKTEGLGTSVLDAFASKLPIVATRAGGIPEMIVNGETGLLAEVGDADQLAKNVLQIVFDPKLRSRLIENGSKKLKKFSKEKTAEKTLSVYRQILEN